MGDSEILKIEKQNIVARLEAVEEHMKTGEENRKVLMTGFNEMKTSLDSMEATLFGSKDKSGVVHQMEAILKVADGIKWVLTKIFLAVCTAVALAMFQPTCSFFSKLVLHQ